MRTAGNTKQTSCYQLTLTESMIF